MSRRTARILSILAEYLRRSWWATVSGFTVIGGTLYGGAPVGLAWQRVADPRTDPGADPDAGPDGDPDADQHAGAGCPASDDVVRREAADGVAEIEAFLAAYRDTPRGGDRG